MDFKWVGSVGKGWAQLVRAAEIMAKAHDAEIEQVKEKFGTLRIYSSGSERFWRVADVLESVSEFTCEECGGLGELRQGGWLKTLCDRCHEERMSEKVQTA